MHRLRAVAECVEGGAGAAPCAGDFYSVKERAADGAEVDFAQFRGKVVYGVNVASRWGFTKPEYALLKELADQFGEKVALLAFPCGQFGGQELPTDAEVLAFAKKRVPSLVVLTKADVKGADARPTYRLLADAFPGKFPPKWNFKGKFLVDAAGKVSVTKDPKADIAKLLA